jgi:FkbM family methyltransferase
LVPRGATVIDVGANFGAYTHELAKCVGRTGRVIALEPIPPTFALLAANLRRRNVRLLNIAASDHTGTAMMSVPAGNFYRAHLQAAAADYCVQCVRLDDVALHQPVQFVKCDVEGHELAVLCGAKRLLQTARPAWLLETARPEQVSAVLAEYGYRPYAWHAGRLRAGGQATNYFYLTAEQVRAARRRGVWVEEKISSPHE